MRFLAHRKIFWIEAGRRAMTNSRRKGKDGELEWANILKEHGYDARRGVQYKGGPDSPDVTGLPGIHQEVKRTNSFSLYKAMEQSRNDADDSEIPIVVHRSDRKPWVVVMDAEDWLRLYYMAQESVCKEDTEREFVLLQNPFE